MNSPKRILFSANDPGGASAILPVVSAIIKRGDACYGFLAGPARDIFARAAVPFTDVQGLTDEALRTRVADIGPQCILAGTSAERFSIDKKIRAWDENVPSVYVLDFWSNYALRFSEGRDGILQLPTVVCVMDELAKQEMIDDGIPSGHIVITGNPSLEHSAIEVSTRSEDIREILFISQPVREVQGMQYGFDEYIVLEHLIDAMKVLPDTYQLIVRLHPKDDVHKYDRYLGRRISLSVAPTLEDALSKAGLVIGMFSQVLIQAAAAGKHILSYEPGLVGRDPLPTNRFGLTKKVGNKEELKTALAAYGMGKYTSASIDLNALWPKGATARIMAVIDDIVR